MFDDNANSGLLDIRTIEGEQLLRMLPRGVPSQWDRPDLAGTVVRNM